MVVFLYKLYCMSSGAALSSWTTQRGRGRASCRILAVSKKQPQWKVMLELVVTAKQIWTEGNWLKWRVAAAPSCGLAALFYSDLGRKSSWIQQNELEQNPNEYINQELFKGGFEMSWIHEVGVSADYDEMKTETEEEPLGEAGWASTVSLTVSWQVQ